MTRRLLCLHGHFYQPPRENPWIEEIEVQDSAEPFHDWNERIAAECYAPNGAARIKDGGDRIVDIVNGYVHLSFNFGPTLLAWLERPRPDVYTLVLEADEASLARRGHGNALAQGYNHAILPLCSPRDRRTPIRSGIPHFHRRPPGGALRPPAPLPRPRGEPRDRALLLRRPHRPRPGVRRRARLAVGAGGAPRGGLRPVAGARRAPAGGAARGGARA